MITARLLVVWGSVHKSVEEWGEYSFLALPSRGDTIIVDRRDVEDRLTVLHMAHNVHASGLVPSIEVVAKWTTAATPGARWQAFGLSALLMIVVAALVAITV